MNIFKMLMTALTIKRDIKALENRVAKLEGRFNIYAPINSIDSINDTERAQILSRCERSENVRTHLMNAAKSVHAQVEENCVELGKVFGEMYEKDIDIHEISGHEVHKRLQRKVDFLVTPHKLKKVMENQHNSSKINILSKTIKEISDGV